MRRFVLALVGSLLSTGVPAQSRPADFGFTVKSTIDSAGHSRTIVQHVQVHGRKMRMDLATVPSKPVLAGTYVILNTADSSITTVMPASRTVSVSLLSSGGLATRGITTTTDVSKTDSVDLGSGGKLAGFSTRHYRLHRGATITTTFPDRVCTRRVNTVREVWVATDTVPGSIVGSAARSLADGIWRGFLPAGQSWMDKIDAAATTSPRSLALRMVDRVVVTRPDQTHVDRTSTVEYTEFSKGAFDPALFEAPAGFRVLDMRHRSAPSADAQRAALTMAEQRLRVCVQKTKP